MSGKPLDCVGVDPTSSEVGKHDFRPSPTEPIIHGPGSIPEVRERLLFEKVTELAFSQNETCRVTRERNALAHALQIIAAGRGGSPQRFAAETLARLESGELRKPDA